MRTPGAGNDTHDDPVTTWHLNRYCVGMTPAIAHRIPRPLSVLTALAALALSAPLALIGAPGHAAPAEDESSVGIEGSFDIVINSDETYTAKFVMTTRTEFQLKKSCTEEAFKTPGTKDVKNVKVNYKEDGDTATCTAEGSQKIVDAKGLVNHKNGEYTVETPDFGTDAAGDDVKFSQSVTFPGKVTEADGGTVEGTKVSFKDNDKHEVKGKDKPAKSAAAGSSKDGAGEDDSGSTPVWVWVVVGVLAVAIVGGIVAAVVMNQRKKNQPPFNPYAAPAQGYDPNQAPLGQPMQQPYQQGQSYQPPYNHQPGQPGQRF